VVRAEASIEDDDVSLELTRAMEELTAPQIAESINLALEANSSLLDDETSAELMKVFGGGRFADSQYMPLRQEKIKDALHLSTWER